MARKTQWRGRDEVLRNMDAYEQKIVRSAEEIAKYFAPQMETHAKANAPWTDRTGNARQSLYGWWDKQGKKVIVFISHGRDYGLWLEIRNSGRYAILWPTVEEFIPQIKSMLRNVFGKFR